MTTAKRIPLTSTADDLIAQAATKENGLATAMGAHSGALRQVIAGLRAEALLPEHVNPGDATLQCLVGEVELVTSSEDFRVTLQSGDLVVIPHERHYLRAITDCAVLITQRSDAHR